MMAESSFSNINGIITLQVGHYSNFVGTHWWNIQQSSRRTQNYANENTETGVESGLFLREDFEAGTRKTIFTPRLLCIDLKGSLKALKEDGSFQKTHGEGRIEKVQEEYEKNELEVDEIAPSNVSIHQTDSVHRPKVLDVVTSGARSRIEGAKDSSLDKSYNMEPNNFSLGDAVEVWSDFLGNEYHQNSVLLLDDYWHSSDSCSFSSFGQGFSTIGNQKFWDSWEDRMHFFAEECDKLQGFQVVTDLEDGFGGLAIRVLEELKDCYGPKSFAIYGCWPGISNKHINENIKIMNSAMAISCVTQQNQLFTPTSLQDSFYRKEQSNRKFKHLSYKPESHYHTSAIIASYLDTISLHYQAGNATLADFCNGMTITGHNVATARMALPLDITSSSIENIFDSNIYEDGTMTSLTPSVTGPLSSLFSHQMVLRGIPSEFEELDASKYRLSRRISNRDVFENHVFNTYKSYKTGSTFCEEPLQTSYQFSRYLKSDTDKNRFLSISKEKKGFCDSAPVLSSLSTAAEAFDLLHDIIKLAKGVKDSMYITMEHFGMEKDEIIENIENLVSVAHLYNDKKATELL